MSAEEAEIGFGHAEVAYVLASIEQQATESAREWLGIEMSEVRDEVLAAGASSLLARGMAHIEDDSVVPSGDALTLRWIMASSTQWVSVALMRDEDTLLDAYLIAASESATAVLQPRALGTWFMAGVREDLSLGDFILSLAGTFVAQCADGVAFVSSVDRGFRRVAFLRKQADDWEIVLPAIDESASEERQIASAPIVAHTLTAALSADSA